MTKNVSLLASHFASSSHLLNMYFGSRYYLLKVCYWKISISWGLLPAGYFLHLSFHFFLMTTLEVFVSRGCNGKKCYGLNCAPQKDMLKS